MLLISPSAICCWKIHTGRERGGEGCFELLSLMHFAPVFDCTNLILSFFLFLILYLQKPTMKYKQVCWASKSILQKKENIRDLPWVRQMIQNNNNKATWFQFSYHKTFWHFFSLRLKRFCAASARPFTQVSFRAAVSFLECYK